MVLVLLLGAERVPPLAEDLGDGAVVLVGMALVHQRPVPFAEDHEGVHRPAHVILFLGLHQKPETRIYLQAKKFLKKRKNGVNTRRRTRRRRSIGRMPMAANMEHINVDEQMNESTSTKKKTQLPSFIVSLRQFRINEVGRKCRRKHSLFHETSTEMGYLI